MAFKDFFFSPQNSLIREVENAKKQLEEAQHDKVLGSSPLCLNMSEAKANGAGGCGAG